VLADSDSPLASVPPEVVLAVVGAVFVAYAVAGLSSTRAFVRRAIRVPGRCVGLQPRTSSSSGDGGFSTNWHPVLEFRTLDGQVLVVESPFGSSPAPARPGQPVGVLYDPSAPHRARLDTATGRGTLLHVIFLVVGLLAGGVGVAIALLS
jgi:hypothetical protein